MALSAASKNRREMRCAYCDVIRKCAPNSSVWAKNWRVNLRFRCDITETPNRPSLSICGVLTLRYGRGKHVSANHEEAKLDKIPDHLIKKWYHLLSQLCDITLIIKWYHLVQLVISLSSKVISHNNQDDITSKARWYHILLINSKTAPHKSGHVRMWSQLVQKMGNPDPESRDLLYGGHPHISLLLWDRLG